MKKRISASMRKRIITFCDRICSNSALKSISGKSSFFANPRIIWYTPQNIKINESTIGKKSGPGILNSEFLFGKVDATKSTTTAISMQIIPTTCS
jgi:hypothetical protein